MAKRQGHPDESLGCRKGHLLHKIGDGDSIFHADVPDGRRQTGFRRDLHTCELALGPYHGVCARNDLQQERSPPYDDAKGKARGTLGHPAESFGLCDVESLAKRASHGSGLLLGNHAVLILSEFRHKI